MVKKYVHKKQVYHGGITSKLDRFKLGNYALFASSPGVVTIAQLNAARIAIRRKVRGSGVLRVCVRPTKPLTSKSCGIRMGKGKGSFNKFVYFVKKDEIIIELALGRLKDFAKRLLLLGSSKLGVRTYIRCN